VRAAISSWVYIFRKISAVVNKSHNFSHTERTLLDEELDGLAVSALRRAIVEVKQRWSVIGWVTKYLLSRTLSEGTLSRWSRLELQSLAPTNPHWARVVGYGPFSLCVIHKEGLCPSNGDTNRLMMRAHTGCLFKLWLWDIFDLFVTLLVTLIVSILCAKGATNDWTNCVITTEHFVLQKINISFPYNTSIMF
jgi:hypothetical protein